MKEAFEEEIKKQEREEEKMKIMFEHPEWFETTSPKQYVINLLKMERIEIIKKRLNEIDVACSKVWEEYTDKALKNIGRDVAWNWYKNQPIIQEQERLEDELRKLKTPEYFDPIEGDDDIYTLQEFMSICKGGGFIDYDGFGVYAFKDKKSDIEIYPSDVKKGNIRTDFTHVVWYNR